MGRDALGLGGGKDTHLFDGPAAIARLKLPAFERIDRCGAA
jgi:hypothetical protein